jgi:hypothetical protein
MSEPHRANIVAAEPFWPRRWAGTPQNRIIAVVAGGTAAVAWQRAGLGAKVTLIAFITPATYPVMAIRVTASTADNASLDTGLSIRTC